MKKITEEASKREIEITISAQGTDISNLKDKISLLEIILLAPQARYFQEELINTTKGYPISIIVLDPMTYGRMDAVKILDEIAKITYS